MDSKTKKNKPVWYYNILGILLVFMAFKLFFKFINQVDKQEQRSEQALRNAIIKEQELQNSYVYGLDLVESGIFLLKMENKPYPLFFVSVSDSSVLRQEALLPILKRVLGKSNAKNQLRINTSFHYRADEAPGEVKYVLDQDFDNVVAEKVFRIKKAKWGGGYDFLEIE